MSSSNCNSEQSHLQEEQQQTSSSSSLFSSLSDALSSFMTPVYADEDKEEEESEETGESDQEGGEEGGDGEAEEAEEEEEEEPEDEYPAIYEECENSKGCAPAKHHFEECQQRVQDGKGFKDENCVEEFFHLAHCASECSAPRLFSKLR